MLGGNFVLAGTLGVLLFLRPAPPRLRELGEARAFRSIAQSAGDEVTTPRFYGILPSAWSFLGRWLQVAQYGVAVLAVGGTLSWRGAFVGHGIHMVGATVGAAVPNQVGVVDGAYVAFAERARLPRRAREGAQRRARAPRFAAAVRGAVHGRRDGDARGARRAARAGEQPLVKRGDWLAALSITALALVVRVLGFASGCPGSTTGTKGGSPTAPAHMLGQPWWEPTVYQYGAPLPWLIALRVRALSVLFPDRLFDPTDSVFMHLVGRAITAVISSSGAFAMYVAGRYATLGDRGARLRAVYASLAYAMAAEMISHGRYAVTDADLAACVAWSLAFGALYVRGGRLLWAFCTLAAGAVAVAFKITAGPAMLVPAVLLLARRLALPGVARASSPSRSRSPSRRRSSSRSTRT